MRTDTDSVTSNSAFSEALSLHTSAWQGSVQWQQWQYRHTASNSRSGSKTAHRIQCSCGRHVVVFSGGNDVIVTAVISVIVLGVSGEALFGGALWGMYRCTLNLQVHNHTVQTVPYFHFRPTSEQPPHHTTHVISPSTNQLNVFPRKTKRKTSFQSSLSHVTYCRLQPPT